ncbi:hypothetical protein PR202_ga02411 [Eleusine coracana subsp. coracana]|uniref:Uncharacterized protein n=1 Tax=Eleusine coracana subsp. coracana TaxID=191504 RepID=A0AAV5BKW8_ELECO|nr:hypothetical protein PR202_ga02411 [Eleusine coracana subsp. coracana]
MFASGTVVDSVNRFSPAAPCTARHLRFVFRVLSSGPGHPRRHASVSLRGGVGPRRARRAIRTALIAWAPRAPAPASGRGLGGEKKTRARNLRLVLFPLASLACALSSLRYHPRGRTQQVALSPSPRGSPCCCCSCSAAAADRDQRLCSRHYFAFALQFGVQTAEASGREHTVAAARGVLCFGNYWRNRAGADRRLSIKLRAAASEVRNKKMLACIACSTKEGGEDGSRGAAATPHGGKSLTSQVTNLSTSSTTRFPHAWM